MKKLFIFLLLVWTQGVHASEYLFSPEERMDIRRTVTDATSIILDKAGEDVGDGVTVIGKVNVFISSGTNAKDVLTSALEYFMTVPGVSVGRLQIYLDKVIAYEVEATLDAFKTTLKVSFLEPLTDGAFKLTFGKNNPIGPVCPGQVFSDFSESRMHPVYHKNMPHTGVDIKAEKNDTLVSPFNGTVVDVTSQVDRWTKKLKGWGRYVSIKNDSTGMITRLAHLNKWLVKKGDKVHIGQPVGLCGKSGTALNYHVHLDFSFEKSFLNPVHVFGYTSTEEVCGPLTPCKDSIVVKPNKGKFSYVVDVGESKKDESKKVIALK